MKEIKIDETQVYLYNLQNNSGRIIIVNPVFGEFSYQWNSIEMENIEAFICSIDSDYFSKKLCKERFEFCPKRSIRAVRRYIRENLSSELPWYKYTSGQKELRGALKLIEGIAKNGSDFTSMMEGLVDGLNCTELTADEKKDFKSYLTPIFNPTPYTFIEYKDSKEVVWLRDIHLKLCDSILVYL